MKRVNNNVKFENVSTEIVDNDVAILNPTNDVLTRLEEAVAQ